MKTAFALLLAAFLAPTFCTLAVGGEKKDNPSMGQTIGATARQVADDAKEAAKETKEAVVKISREVAKEAKEGYQETKAAAKQFGEDVKTGFQKEPAADKSKKNNSGEKGSD